jgi:hypothetical protein
VAGLYLEWLFLRINIRKYPEEIQQIVDSTYRIANVVPVIEVFYIPAFLGLIIGFVKYWEISLSQKEKVKGLLTRTFYHEVGDHLTIFSRDSYGDLFEDVNNPSPEEIEDYVNLLETESFTIRTLLKTLKIEHISPKDIRDSAEYFNLGRIVEKEASGSQAHLQTRALYLNNNLSSDEPDSYTSLPLIAALLSIHTGDCLKWAPEKTVISQEVRRDENSIVLNWENNFGEFPFDLTMGLNEGLGTKFTERYLNAMGGTIERYSVRKIAETARTVKFGDLESRISDGKLFGKEIRIPLSSLQN